MRSVNPATGVVIEEYSEASASTLKAAAAKAEAVARNWGWERVEARCEPIVRLGDALRGGANRLARLMALEMGKPVDQGRAEVEKCAWVCDYYAKNAPGILAPGSVNVDEAAASVVFRPLGVVLGVMPWNFPFWQVLRFAVPTVAAGNTVLLKHASNVPQCALEIERLFAEAGFPQGVFQTLLTDASGVDSLLRMSAVKAVSLTGSTGAGSAVAAVAGKHIKKSLLELGGSDPYLILEDADIDAAAQACVNSRLINSGQSCIAAKRLIAVDAVHDEFRDAVVAAMESRAVGNPLTEVDVGPLARRGLAEELQQQVDSSLAAGARRIVGEDIEDGTEAAFFPITVLEDVAPGQPAFDEELFGPVAAVIRARDEREAVALANQSSFGLGAAVFTQDLERGRQIAADFLEAGFCAVNDFVRSDPRLPFGGVKTSGYGRELGEFGILEFVNVKTVYIAGADAAS